jgi:hypothetical protein
MLSPRRILNAVTPRRVVAFLLLGGFAEEITSAVHWLVSVGWGLKDVATLRGFLLAGAAFAFNVGLVYLTLRTPAWLLDRRRRRARPSTIVAKPALGERDPTVPLDELDTTGIDEAGWPQEGGSNGRSREHY